MFRAKRSDTTVRSIEHQHGIDLNARSDMQLGNLLRQRGFDSLSQLLQAYRQKLTYHARRRRVFLSFHEEDRPQVHGLRTMARNKWGDIDFHDTSVRVAIKSENRSYIRRVIRQKLRRSTVLLCLIGNGTKWRKWVETEIEIARKMGKGICGARLKGSRGQIPEILAGAPLVRKWDPKKIISAIECAAARRS